MLQICHWRTRIQQVISYNYTSMCTLGFTWGLRLTFCYTRLRRCRNRLPAYSCDIFMIQNAISFSTIISDPQWLHNPHNTKSDFLQFFFMVLVHELQQRSSLRQAGPQCLDCVWLKAILKLKNYDAIDMTMWLLYVLFAWTAGAKKRFAHKH